MIGHEDKKKSMLIGMAGQYSGHAVRKASKQKKGIGAVRGGKNSAASLRGGTGSSSASASSPSLGGSGRLFGGAAGATLARTAMAASSSSSSSPSMGGGSRSASVDPIIPAGARTAAAVRVGRSGLSADAALGGGAALDPSGSSAALASAAAAADGGGGSRGMGGAAAGGGGSPPPPLAAAAGAAASPAGHQAALARTALVKAPPLAAPKAPQRVHGWLALKSSTACDEWQRLYCVLRGGKLLAFSEEVRQRRCGRGSAAGDELLEDSLAEATFELSADASVLRQMLLLVLRPTGARRGEGRDGDDDDDDDDDDVAGCWCMCAASEAEAAQWRISLSDAIDTANYVQRHLARAAAKQRPEL